MLLIGRANQHAFPSVFIVVRTPSREVMIKEFMPRSGFW